MAFDAYIHIAEITGEALDQQYANWIEIVGYKFGASQSTSATASSAGGASSGRTTLTNFTFTKYLDSASCKLLAGGVTGGMLGGEVGGKTGEVIGEMIYEGALR